MTAAHHGFDDPRQVFATIAPERFARLEVFARDSLPRLDLANEAVELGLVLGECLDAVTDPGRFSATDHARAFAPFEGEWLGGDIHDSRRVYRHIWYPTEVADDGGVEGGFAAQKVLMLDVEGRATPAYDFCELSPPARITGLVGERAHRGYVLPDRGLLWLGEERDAQISVHLERVRAGGQLYDIRGVVVAGTEIRARSDWRYHRLRRGAVAAHLRAR